MPLHTAPRFLRDDLPTDRADAGYTVTVTRRPEDIRAAQRLRYDIFSGEFSAATQGPAGLDADELDPTSDHLVVWHRPDRTMIPGPRRSAVSEAVATYRLLPPGRSQNHYAAAEFDLRALRDILPYTVETGRSCVRVDHRNGATMALLWSAIGEYMMRGGHRYLLGCASVPLLDGGEAASGVWHQIQWRQLDRNYHCEPWRAWHPVPPPPALIRYPPLLQGYLRLGATVLGPPAHDPAFNCADFLVLLDLQSADPRYLRRFLPDAHPVPGS